MTTTIVSGIFLFLPIVLGIVGVAPDFVAGSPKAF